MTKRQNTLENRARAQELFRDGKSITEIEQEMNCSRMTVYKLLGELYSDRQRDKRERIERDEAQIMRRYRAGESIRAIAKHYHVATDTLSDMMKRLGHDIAPHGLREQEVQAMTPEFVCLWQDGLSVDRIALMTNVSRQTIRRKLVAAGVYDPKRDGNSGYKYGKATTFEFVEVWQTSETADEAARRLGIETKLAVRRASHYRSRGIPLKRMLRTGYNWDELREFAELFLDSEEAP
jgi:transposase